MFVLVVLAVLVVADAVAGFVGVSGSFLPVALLCAGMVVAVHDGLMRARK